MRFICKPEKDENSSRMSCGLDMNMVDALTKKAISSVKARIGSTGVPPVTYTSSFLSATACLASHTRYSITAMKRRGENGLPCCTPR